MKYSLNGWIEIDADNIKDANQKLKKIILESLVDEKIIFVENLNGAWKKYNFNNWFEINARSSSEAMKRIKSHLSKSTLTSLNDEEEEINIDFLVDDVKSGVLHKFSMTNGSTEYIHEIMAVSARDAWEDLRSNFIYDEHVILTQIINMPCTISPKWRALDATKGISTPDCFTHQIVIAVGFAGESWWGNKKDVIVVDEKGFISNKLENVFS